MYSTYVLSPQDVCLEDLLVGIWPDKTGRQEWEALKVSPAALGEVGGGRGGGQRVRSLCKHHVAMKLSNSLHLCIFTINISAGLFSSNCCVLRILDSIKLCRNNLEINDNCLYVPLWIFCEMIKLLHYSYGIGNRSEVSFVKRLRREHKGKRARTSRQMIWEQSSWDSKNQDLGWLVGLIATKYKQLPEQVYVNFNIQLLTVSDVTVKSFVYT